jgi:hypothetical protein
MELILFQKWFKECKILIERNDLESFKTYLIENFSNSENIDLSFVFQKVYLHACLKFKNSPIIDYLENEVYNYLPEIERIAIRQVFPYGRYLRSKHKN